MFLKEQDLNFLLNLQQLSYHRGIKIIFILEGLCQYTLNLQFISYTEHFYNIFTFYFPLVQGFSLMLVFVGVLYHKL